MSVLDFGCKRIHFYYRLLSDDDDSFTHSTVMFTKIYASVLTFADDTNCLRLCALEAGNCELFTSAIVLGPIWNAFVRQLEKRLFRAAGKKVALGEKKLASVEQRKWNTLRSHVIEIRVYHHIDIFHTYAPTLTLTKNFRIVSIQRHLCSLNMLSE